MPPMKGGLEDLALARERLRLEGEEGACLLA
jgi:hypothetical protein